MPKIQNDNTILSNKGCIIKYRKWGRDNRVYSERFTTKEALDKFFTMEKVGQVFVTEIIFLREKAVTR